MKVLLVDDHAILLDGIKSLLLTMDGFEIVGAATTVAGALSEFERCQPELVITDYSLPDDNGAALVRQLRHKSDDVKVLVLSMHSEVHIVKEVLRAGVNGYMLKHDPHNELALALAAVAAGKVYLSNEINQLLLSDLNQPDPAALLTSREKEVLQLIGKEYSNKQIADELFIGERTVETHRKNLFRKTGSKSVVGLIRWAFNNGFD